MNGVLAQCHPESAPIIPALSHFNQTEYYRTIFKGTDRDPVGCFMPFESFSAASIRCWPPPPLMLPVLRRSGIVANEPPASRS